VTALHTRRWAVPRQCTLLATPAHQQHPALAGVCGTPGRSACRSESLAASDLRAKRVGSADG
jgi:hypothetical protein